MFQRILEKIVFIQLYVKLVFKRGDVFVITEFVMGVCEEMSAISKGEGWLSQFGM